jgi:hypothetical protein
VRIGRLVMTSLEVGGTGAQASRQVSIPGPLAGAGERDIQDPAESWERPVASSAAARIGLHGGRLRLSPSDAELPPGGQRALRACCGSIAPDHLLLVAPYARPIDLQRRRYVSGAAALLGLGERGTGLWVQGHERGVAVSVPHERIGFIEDVWLLGYGRLAVRSADARLAIRYDPATRAALAAAITELRMRATGEERHGLPWSGVRAVDDGRLADRAGLAIDRILADAGAEEAAALVDTLPGAPSGAGDRLVAVVLTPRELIITAETGREGLAGITGHDLVAVPRRRLQRATAADGTLALRSANADRILRIGVGLARATAELVTAAAQRAAPSPA